MGTSFNVNAYKQSKEFETALLTGKVEISDRITARVLSLAPNNRAVLGNNGLSVVPIESKDYYLWREGILYFDEPLTEVLDKLKLYFDVNIDVKINPYWRTNGIVRVSSGRGMVWIIS